MSQEQIKTMQEVTYFNGDTGFWGYYGGVSDFDSQKDAYDAYLAT